jgi:serine/threonine protein kinase
MLDVVGDESEDEDVLAKGTSVGRYTVLERLGAGGMGVVYAAYDPELDRKIALKFLLGQQETEADNAHRRERLVREAKAIAKLSHPNVVGIFDVGVHEGRVFLAMEYLGGGTLRDWMNARKRPWREIVKMFIEVGQGLAAAHAEGLIHRDFKPDNVLIDKAGKPKVADFGLVRLRSTGLEASGPIEQAALEISETAHAPLTRTGAIAGTPAYRPVRVLRRALRGAVWGAAVRGGDGDGAGGGGVGRAGQPGAQGQRRSELDSKGAAAGVGRQSFRSLRVRLGSAERPRQRSRSQAGAPVVGCGCLAVGRGDRGRCHPKGGKPARSLGRPGGVARPRGEDGL